MRKQKILIVEDEAILRESLRDWLSEDGYDVDCAGTGKEALTRVKSTEYGILVIDLGLPDIDGFEVYQQAKNIRVDTQGIIITAYPSKETMEKARQLGLLDYLAKPFQMVDLEKVVEMTLKWVTGNES